MEETLIIITLNSFIITIIKDIKTITIKVIALII